MRSVIKGGAKYQHMLVDAFATHLLGVQVNPQRIKTPALDLTALRLGFQVPQALQDGFVTVQVKSLTVMSPDRGLKVEFTATASGEHRCVTELVADHFAADSPIAQGWEVEAARINLYYPPAPGRSRTKVIVVEVTCRGRLNLHKYDEQLRAQLEGYLITLACCGRSSDCRRRWWRPKNWLRLRFSDRITQRSRVADAMPAVANPWSLVRRIRDARGSTRIWFCEVSGSGFCATRFP